MDHHLGFRTHHLVMDRVLQLQGSQMLKARLDRIQSQLDSGASPEGRHRPVIHQAG